MKIIGNHEARTHWSQILQSVKSGERYAILHKGELIAELVPPQVDSRQVRSKHAAAKLLQLMLDRPHADIDLKGLIGEGRD